MFPSKYLNNTIIGNIPLASITNGFLIATLLIAIIMFFSSLSIMISNLYNAYNPFVDTVEGFFEGLPRGGRQPKPEKPKPKPENPEEKKVAKGLTAGRAWLSEASAASLMRQIKKRKRGRGQGGKDDDTQLTAVGAPPAMGTAQGGGGGPGDTFANRLSYSELDGALQMSAAENTHNASR